jgi:hypothetical protein
MRTLLVVATAIALTPAFAQQKPGAAADSMVLSTPGKAAAASVVKITALVEAIDHAARTATLKGPRGNVVTVDVGPEVKNFDQIKAGDLVVLTYAEALSLELKKGGSGIRERSERTDVRKPQAGGTPGAGARRDVTVMADVVAVDPKASTITLRGPKRTVTLKVRNPDHFKVVKVGDQVEATYTEAVALSIEPAQKPAAKK